MAKALQSEGFPAVMFLPSGSPAWKEAESQGLRTIHLPPHRKYFDIPAALLLMRSLQAEGVNLLIFRDNFDMSLCASVKFLLGKSLRTIYFQGMQLGVSKKNIFHRLRYSFIDAWVCPLEWLKNQAIKMAAIAPGKVRVIPLGTDVNTVENSQLRNSVRAELAVPDEELCAGIMGRLDRAKGQDVAIRAIALLREMGKSMHLLIQGEATRGEGDEYSGYLHELVRSNKLENFVHFLPFNAEVAGFYNSIEIAVVASKNETFGMVTVEALAWGKAVVGTNSAGTPEILSNGACGLLFEPGNARELAECLRRLSDEPELRLLLAKSAKARALDFSTSRMAMGLRELIRELTLS